MKPVTCKHCGAIDQHHSFQCHTQRKPIKKKGTPIVSFVMTKNDASKSIKKSKPIPKLSDKEKKRQAAYSVLKKEFMKTRLICQVKLPGCTGNAVDVHHLFSGADRYKYFLDSTTWLSTCRFCHHIVHNELSSEELIELGLRKKE